MHGDMVLAVLLLEMKPPLMLQVKLCRASYSFSASVERPEIQLRRDKLSPTGLRAPDSDTHSITCTNGSKIRKAHRNNTEPALDEKHWIHL